jgi:hypothetical protein
MGAHRLSLPGRIQERGHDRRNAQSAEVKLLARPLRKFGA